MNRTRVSLFVIMCQRSPIKNITEDQSYTFDVFNLLNIQL